MAGVRAPWAGHGELVGEGRGRGRGGRCWEAPWGAARVLWAGCGPAAACVRSLLFMVSADREKKGNRKEE
jgi:hypothetical protein